MKEREKTRFSEWIQEDINFWKLATVTLLALLFVVLFFVMLEDSYQETQVTDIPAQTLPDYMQVSVNNFSYGCYQDNQLNPQGGKNG